MSSLLLHGRRRSFIELQKWCYLRASAKILQNGCAFVNSFSSASAANMSPKDDGRKGQSFTVSYLVDSLGLTSKLAESISRKVNSEEKANPDSVLSLLRSHGFTDSQISSIITDYPGLLIVDAEKSLGPKLHFLQSRGVSTSEFTEIVSKVPKILGKRAGKTSGAYYDFVKEIIQADKNFKFQKLSHSVPKGSQHENKLRNLSVLRELGMPQKLLFSMLICNASTVCGKEKFEESLNNVVEMGFDPTTTKFVQAFNFFYRLSDSSIEEKVNVYKKLGFAEEDVWEMFKKWPFFLAFSEKKVLNSVETFLGLGFSRDEFVMMVKRVPSCIGLSEETVKKKTEYMVKKMNWSLNSVALFSQVFSYSLEKRIVPRCKVIRALMSKGLLIELPLMATALIPSNEVFLKMYVMKHGDDKQLVAELMTIFTGKDVKKQF